MVEVCVKIFEDRAEAEMFRCFLEDHGIESYIKVDECGGCSHMEDECGGVKLIVDERDKLDALKIVDETCEDE